MNMNIKKKIKFLIKKGSKALDSNEYKAAFSYFEEANSLLTVPNNDLDTYIWLCGTMGDIKFIQKEYKEALVYFQRCYNTGEVDNPFINLRLGECYYENQDYNNAKEFLLQAYMLEGKEIFVGIDMKYYYWLEKEVVL